MKNPGLIIVPGEKSLSEAVSGLPALVRRAGKPAVAAWKDFFDGKLANANTRIAYARAVRQFLEWCEAQGLELRRVMAGDVGRYLREHSGCLSTQKQHLAALRCYFNMLVERYLREYVRAVGLEDAPKVSPLFRTAVRKENRMTRNRHDRFRRVPHGETASPTIRIVGIPFSALLPRGHRDRSARPGRSPGRGAIPPRPRRPPHHPPQRPAGKAGDQEHRGEDFNLIKWNSHLENRDVIYSSNKSEWLPVRSKTRNSSSTR